MKYLIILSIILFKFDAYSVPIISKEISYRWNDIQLGGYLAKPAKLTKKTPAILIVHEGWGLNDYPKSRAKKLAELGYIALALDMYGNGTIAKHPKEESEFTKAVMSDSTKLNGVFRSAYYRILQEENVDEKKVAAIGYCFGGGVVIEMANRGLPLAGVISVHGGVKTRTLPLKGVIQSKVLIQNGELDPMISKETKQEFIERMKEASVEVKWIDYKKARHGFSNPEATELGKKFGTPVEYNAAADKQSWNDMKVFLKSIF